MKRWAPLGFLIAILAQPALTADVKLEIAPPSQPEWLLPPTSLPCTEAAGVRLESCATQLHPEGISTARERTLVSDLEPLLTAQDYDAVLARIRENYETELTLLEAGDAEGFLRIRVPSAGDDQPLQRAARGPSGGVSSDFETDRSTQAFTNAFGQRRGMTMGPDTISASVLYVIGHSYLALERYLPAETAFELALRALPDHVRARESLGMLHLRAGRYADARAHLARAVELGRNTAHIHAALGFLELKTRRYWAAANAFQRALALEPDHTSAQRGFLHALIESHEHGKARALVERMLLDQPDDPSLWLYRARTALAAEERGIALASLETALRLGDDSLMNRLSCAALHIESGSIERAVELLNGSGGRGVDYRLLDRALGWLANESRWNDYRELIDAIDGGELGAVEQSRLLTRRARLALHDGNRGAARTMLQDALARDPSNADALVALGQIYRAEGDPEWADLTFRRASVYAAVREHALVALTEVAIEQGDFDAALAFLRDAAAENALGTGLRRNIELLEEIVLLRTER